MLAEGQASCEVKATLRFSPPPRCGPLNAATTARIQALGLALLDFSGADDLAAWLAVHAG